MPPEQFDVAQVMAAVRQEQVGWQAGETTMTALPEQERRYRLGYVPGPGEPSLAAREQIAQALLARAPAAADYPRSFDLRSVGGQNFITPVKDQGSCGSCVAFGTIATVEGTLRFSRSDPNLAVDYSEAHLFYCLARAEGRNCGNGWWPDAALKDFQNTGGVVEACYPYTPGDQACSGLCADWQNRVTKISGYHALTSPDDMKKWLSTRGPLVTCLTIYDDFYAYRTGVYRHVTGNLAGGHCVCCVGYDDAQGCWICKNSWSTGWGDAGFFRIAYGQVGIDATMWAVDGIVTAVWHNNTKITSLWATNEERNAWAYVDGVGWRRVAYDSDSIFINMLTLLASAKASGRPVNLYEDQGVIKQVYVL